MFERIQNKEILAVQLIDSIYDGEDKRLGKPGDWIITEDNKQYYMTDEEFQKTFRKITIIDMGGITVKPLPTRYSGSITYPNSNEMCFLQRI